MTCDVISTGSGGNAVVLGGRILIDCGVPFKKLAPFARPLILVLLTHQHGDHFKKSAVQRLAKERPALRWALGEHMLPQADGVISTRNIDLVTPGVEYHYRMPGGSVALRPVALRHDVPNFGYHLTICPDGLQPFRVFYATDTGDLDGIEAKDYDLYLIEANYTEEDLRDREAAKLANGEFSYEARAAVNHLSQEQATAWLAENAGGKSRVIYLHQHQERK